MRQKSQWALISLWLILLGSFIHMGLTVMPPAENYHQDFYRKQPRRYRQLKKAHDHYLIWLKFKKQILTWRFSHNL
ncbi:hypothetical protein WP50_18460 [Lactiplantibacillus plantarum]|nr:hypothetical protein WP50_18460 [Lactiplantibacillus plantarum]